MKGEKFDFYDSSSIKIYNLDQKLRYELMILDNLDAMTKVHCENVGNLTFKQEIHSLCYDLWLFTRYRKSLYPKGNSY